MAAAEVSGPKTLAEVEALSYYWGDVDASGAETELRRHPANKLFLLHSAEKTGSFATPLKVEVAKVANNVFMRDRVYFHIVRHRGKRVSGWSSTSTPPENPRTLRSKIHRLFRAFEPCNRPDDAHFFIFEMEALDSAGGLA